jgi:hypothetical protein
VKGVLATRGGDENLGSRNRRSWKERDDLASDSVHTEEPWRTIEANTLKVEEQIVDERSARTHRSPHCLAYADDTGIDTTAREGHLISQTAFSHRASLEQPGTTASAHAPRAN